MYHYKREGTLAKAVCLVAVAWAGCGGHGGSSTGGNSQGGTGLKANIGVDMANVAGFVVAPPTDPVSSHLVRLTAQPQNELYALGTDGTLTVVSVAEQPDGGQSSTTTEVEPLGVFNTSGYVFLAYNGVTHGSDTCNFVLLRKSDGALYCLAGVPLYQPPMVPFSFVQNWVQTDSTGTIVWMNYAPDGAIVRVDLTNPSQLTVTQVAQTNTAAGTQSVNAAGDDLIAGLSGSLPFLRVLLPSGGFQNITASHNVSCLVAGASTNPNDFYYSDNTSWEFEPSLMKLTWSASNSFTSTAITGSTGTMINCTAGVARTSGHVLFSDAQNTNTATNAQFLDLSNDVPTLESAAPLATAQMMAACGTTAFIVGTDAAGNGGIVAYDPATATVSTLLTPGDYSLSAMDVSTSCEVTFYGQRASDGAFILGNVPAGGGSVSVIATGLPTVTQIQRIN